MAFLLLLLSCGKVFDTTGFDPIDPTVVEPSLSTATSSLTNVDVDDVSTTTINITLKNGFGNPIVGVVPTFSVDTEIAGTQYINFDDSNTYGICSASDANGFSTCTLSSWLYGKKRINVLTPVPFTGGTVDFDCPVPLTAVLAGNGTIGTPYLIPNYKSLLMSLCAAYGEYVEQTADIDLAGIDFKPLISPGGYDYNLKYNGGGFKIQNLNINLPDNNNETGFIGNLSAGATLHDITFEGANIIGKTATGVAVGKLNGGGATNVTVDGSGVPVNIYCYAASCGAIAGNQNGGAIINGIVNTVTITSDPAASVGSTYKYGGIAGSCQDDVTGSTSTNVTINAANTNSVGGICGGWTGGSNFLNNSVSGATLTGKNETAGLIGVTSNSKGVATTLIDNNSVNNTTIDGESNTGGLIGSADKNLSTSVTISKNYVTNSVVVTGTYAVGGIIGRANEILINLCYSHATVNAGSGGVGGIIGVIETSPTGLVITNSYVATIINSPASKGSIWGINNQTQVVTGWSDLYWDGQVTLIATDGPSASAITQNNKLTSEMQDTVNYATEMPGLDFTTEWNAPTVGNYPTLQ